jgi:tetratricopeptide (TPR) repeat protein
MNPEDPHMEERPTDAAMSGDAPAPSVAERPAAAPATSSTADLWSEGDFRGELPEQRRKEWLPVPAFHGAYLAGVFVAALALYLSTLCRGVFPGEPAVLLALHSSVAPLPALTHPLWDGAVRLLARVPAGSLTMKLAVFSAVSGALAVALLFHLLSCMRSGLASTAARVRHTAEGAEWIPRSRSQSGDSLLRHAPALFGALLWAGCFPFWFVSTRAHTDAFGLALVLGAAAAVARYHRTARPGAMASAALLLGLSLAEAPAALLLAPAILVWAAAAMVRHNHMVLPFMTDTRRGGLKVRLPLLGVGLVVAAFAAPILVRAAFLLGEPAAAWADVKNYGDALLAVVRAMWMEGRSLIPRLGWILLGITIGFPLALVVGSSMGERPGHRGLPLLAYLFSAAFAVVLAFDPPFAPWPMFGMSPLYVTPYVILACWAAFAVAGAIRLLLRDLARTDLPTPLARHDLTPWFRRRMAWGLTVATIAAASAAGIYHAAPIRGAASDLFDGFAEEVLDESAGCEWLVTASPFEHVLALAAAERGSPLRMLDARMGRTPAYLRYVAASFPGDPRVRGLSDVGLEAVLLDWFARGEGLSARVAVLDIPDLWTAGGYAPVPGHFLYRGVDAPSAGELAARAAGLGVWTDRLAEMRAQSEALPWRIRPYGAWIVGHAGRVLNDLGVALEQVGRTNDAMAAYNAVAAHDPNNYSARRNRQRLALASGRAEAGAYTADLDRLVVRMGGRVDAPSASRVHGRILDASAAMTRGLRAAAGGQVDLALSEVLQAVRLSDDPRIQMTLAAVLEGRGDLAESRKVLDELARRAPDNEGADLARTSLALRTGDFDAAEAGIRRAAGNPKTAAAGEILAVLLDTQRGALTSATARVVRMQTLRPDDPAVLSMAAYVAWQRGDTEAVRIADQALTRRNQKVPLVAVLAAASEAARGRLREARKRLEETAILAPGYAPAWDALLRLDYAERRRDAAQAHVAHLLRLRPSHPLANLYLASFQMEEGRHAEAETALRIALRGMPGDPSILNDLAWCLLCLDRPKDALPFARQAVAAAPGTSDILDTLGLALARTGRPDEAAPVLEEAIKLSPKDDEIRKHLKEVRAAQAAAAGREDLRKAGRP